MIEVTDINPINKGGLLASCSVHIIPWKLTLHEVKIFQKGANRWLTMPCKEVVNDAGEKKYIELMSFDSEAVKNRFRSQILQCVDKFLADNPEMKMEDIIKQDDGLPF